jgi:hypothetical protein
MSAPCGGCPPCCSSCVFSPAPSKTLSRRRRVRVIVPAEEYGCVRPDGGPIVKASGGSIGMMRHGGRFHPVSPEGAVFLRKSGNPLAQHIT